VNDALTTVRITSFGYLDGRAPAAHLLLDLRDHFRDVARTPRAQQLTAAHKTIRTAVLTTPGIGALLDATATAVRAFRSAPAPRTPALVVAIGSVSGRHRAATFAALLADRLTAEGVTVELTHRDHRPGTGER
jgi:UPF0042 nucleotide-binding protein